MTYGIYVDTILGKLYLAEEEECLVRLDGGLWGRPYVRSLFDSKK